MDPNLPTLNHQDLDRVFASQYVQSGTFGAEAQGIENSVKGVGWVSASISAAHQRNTVILPVGIESYHISLIVILLKIPPRV